MSRFRTDKPDTRKRVADASKAVLVKTKPFKVEIVTGITRATDSVPGALDHATRVKPVSGFVNICDRIIVAAQSRQQPLRIAVVGAGAGGMELALATHYRMHAVLSR